MRMRGHRALAVIESSIHYRIPRCARWYHSYERDSPYPYSPDEDAILSAAITHVPEHGFTAAALSKGARDAGYLDVSTNLFPTAAFSLVKYHLVTQRLALGKHASTNTDTASTSVLDNVRALTLQRLRSSQPIIHRWQEVCYRAFAAKPLVMKRRKLTQKIRLLLSKPCQSMFRNLCANLLALPTRYISSLAIKASILPGTPSAQHCRPSMPAPNCS